LAVVRGYDLREAGGACPACGLSRREWSMLKSRFGCDPTLARSQGLEPTRTLCGICGTTAELLACEALKWLSGHEEHALDGEELAYSLLPHRAMRSRLDGNPQCRCPHQRWGVRQVHGTPEELTLKSLLEGTPAGQGTRSGLDRVQIHGERAWMSFALCGGCLRKVPVRRFAAAGEALGDCRCAEPLVASPIGARHVLPPADLQAVWEMPLSALSVRPGEAIGVSVLDPDENTYLFVGEPSISGEAAGP
jgi:hypothetical protein